MSAATGSVVREVKLAGGRTVLTDRPIVPLVEYQRLGEAAGFRFRCPKCGHVASSDNFGRLGRDRGLAAEECIGRYVDREGCDWAAYGLLGTLGDGVLVEFPDGRIVEAFTPAEGGPCPRSA